MNIKFIENTKHRILFELGGFDDTFCNLLKDELWNDSDVKVSAYKKEHPLVSVPKFIVETSKSDALEAVFSAIKRIEALNKKFLTVFDKA